MACIGPLYAGLIVARAIGFVRELYHLPTLPGHGSSHGHSRPTVQRTGNRGGEAAHDGNVTPIAPCSRRGPGVALRRTCCYIGLMSRTIAQRELRNDNAKVIEAVTAGETFVVTRNGEPVAELRPFRAGRRTFISRDEVAVLARANVRIDREQFRADLDDVIDQGL